MPWFLAPVIKDGSTVSYDKGIHPLGNQLMRHFEQRGVGRNIYKWSDGTISERESPRGLDDIVTIWYGGHVAVPVSDEDAALLEAAGYGDGLSDTPPED